MFVLCVFTDRDVPFFVKEYGGSVGNRRKYGKLAPLVERPREKAAMPSYCVGNRGRQLLVESASATRFLPSDRRFPSAQGSQKVLA